MTLELKLRKKPRLCQVKIRQSSRVSVPPRFYGFYITFNEDTFISDITLINLVESSNDNDELPAPEAAKWID